MNDLDTNRFICLLGIDGSGKSTLLNAVASQYPELVIADWHQFPGVSQIPTLAPGLDPPEVLRQLGPYARAAQLCYFAALEYDTVIRPAVAAGRPVIVDSYWYKFAAKMRVLEMAAPFLYTACQSLPSPMKVVFLDTPAEIACHRKQNLNFFECKGQPTEFIPFQRAVRAEMLRFVREIPLIYLDGCLPIDGQVRQLMAACASDLSLLPRKTGDWVGLPPSG